MLTAIQFNDQLFAWRAKVNNIVSNGMSPAPNHDLLSKSGGVISKMNIAHLMSA
ncbi:MAG TPA: hypothetical protein VK249_33180 [Anaerolineales bacterium]|nr:hypothetical protein [Anaerolineales bacterium]